MSENEQVDPALGAMVPVKPDDDAQRLNPLALPKLAAVASFDLTDPMQMLQAVACMGPADLDLDHLDRDTLWHVKAWVAHMVTWTNKTTGEISRDPRVVLITDEGKTIEWLSRITTDYWTRIISAAGRGPWSPGLAVRMTKHDAGEQGYYCTILPVIPNEKQKPKGK